MAAPCGAMRPKTAIQDNHELDTFAEGGDEAQVQ